MRSVCVCTCLCVCERERVRARVRVRVCVSESDCDSGMCDCSSLKSIMKTLDLILCFQCVIYTLRDIWGFMYGHVCETGGTRDVLFPRPLKRVTCKDLL